MQSVQRTFQAIEKKFPDLSSYICFARSIQGRSFSRKTIQNWFKKLVDSDDYNPADRNSLIGQLHELSKMPVGGTFQEENASRRGLNRKLVSSYQPVSESSDLRGKLSMDYPHLS